MIMHDSLSSRKLFARANVFPSLTLSPFLPPCEPHLPQLSRYSRISLNFLSTQKLRNLGFGDGDAAMIRYLHLHMTPCCYQEFKSSLYLSSAAVLRASHLPEAGHCNSGAHPEELSKDSQ